MKTNYEEMLVNYFSPVRELKLCNLADKFFEKNKNDRGCIILRNAMTKSIPASKQAEKFSITADRAEQLQCRAQRQLKAYISKEYSAYYRNYYGPKIACITEKKLGIIKANGWRLLPKKWIKEIITEWEKIRNSPKYGKIWEDNK